MAVTDKKKDRPDLTPELDDDEVVLEPTIPIQTSAGRRPDRSLHAAVVHGHAPSLTTETNALLQDRLRAAVVFLLVACGLLLTWVLISYTNALPAVMLGLRILLLAPLLVILIRQPMLPTAHLRRIEAAIFGGMTIIQMVAEYIGSRALIQSGDVPGLIALEKNGVIGLVFLMVLYGMLIPSEPRRAARVVLSMAIAPLLVMAILLEREEPTTQIIERLGAVDHTGVNALFVLLGAGLSIYGAAVLNRLRSEVHEARRFGQYQLVRKLGSGGMGEVHLAEHQLLKRPCALKLIHPYAAADPLAQARFEREVRAAAKLTHPNTIDIYDYGHSEDGTFYYVMEYLPGLSLAELVDEFGPLPAGRVIYLLRQACAGLAEAHGLGLIHRDLKPANLFVAIRGGEFDVAKVLDFGLVKPTHEPESAMLTADQTVSGTPMYMSPEQAGAQKDLDGRSDIFALGGIAYFALTGQPPFTGSSPMAIMIAAARDPVVPPSKIRPDVPADLEAVVLRCLEKSPAERYPDVKALANALDACAAAADWDLGKAEHWWAEQAQARVQAQANTVSTT